ncbi:YtxH domain-containing protein [Campylobacter sp. RM13119]|uniref:YtxH domain-containing protein n=1 Tax=Campylobacter californiensis TaxID=1032243 RepID=UPI001475A597|nr:YtxH domain-containing protein [Campylobacter sp. RM13119]MBE3606942.1 YtxH domain-containing protein [Campylobacter sp. RM13119]
MKNPYIDNQEIQVQVTTPPQNGVDKAINKAAKELPFVPENFNAAGFIKGLLIGGVAAYVLTNPKAQERLFKAIIKGGELVNAGIEELKERFEDVKAELEAQK